MKKSLVLAMAMALGVTASAYAANPFSDVPAGHWAYDSINKLAAAGIVDGYGDSTFGGDRLMTRYEMAQIVAKAMAKGANVDRLAAEFADELDSLGVRVAALEKKSDNVKINAQIRAMYQSYDKGTNLKGTNLKGTNLKGTNATSTLRSRIWLNGQINEDWKYVGMLQNEQDLLNDEGDENTDFQRAFVTGRIGGVKVEAGRNNTALGLGVGNILSNRTDAVKLGFGKDLKVGFQYGKISSGNGVAPKADEYLAATLGGEIGKLGLNAGYVKADNVRKLVQDDKIWYVGADYKFGDFTVDATYLKSDVDKVNTMSVDEDGYVIGLAYKGAKAAKAGTYGVYAKYYDQGAGTYIHHGMNTDLANDFNKEGGFKGYMLGLNYAFAKNIVAAVEYSDFDAKETDKNDKTIWSEVVFTF
ncbi:porin [uncultured Phascolarctobacterium sp.]|uniref:porin n=1 Tax=uncultured Phascolarctobacterium sp. TaxID=512296 RepID=UPI00265D00C6|nr:porin [uncultured Phascolarctobacterium sp.]